MCSELAESDFLPRVGAKTKNAGLRLEALH